MTDLDALNSWEHWSDFLYRLGAISTPADLQGFAAGLFAGGDKPDADQWRALAEEFMDLPEPLADIESKEAIAAYAILAHRALADQDYGFRLLMPDDAVSLGQRAEALGAWCQSFLVGFGMSGCDADSLDDDGRDMLESLAEISQIDADLEESEDNERLYAELCEFLRVSGIYLYQAAQKPDAVTADLGQAVKNANDQLH